MEPLRLDEDVACSSLPISMDSPSPRSNYDYDDADQHMNRQSSKNNRRAVQYTHDGDGSNTGGYTPGVFLDVAAMKDRVRDALKKPVYNVQDLYSDKGVWQWLARSTGFEQVTLVVIAVNAIWIAVDTDSNDADILLQAHIVFQLAENLFCLFFVFELFTRFMAFRKKRSCLTDTWFVFDSILVFTMVIETWLMSIVVLLSDDGGSGGFGNASILRIARLLRLSRMARMVRLLRIMPELMIMIKGMMAAIRSVFFTLLLLVIIMYVFGIAFTQLLSETAIGEKYYNSVPASMYTLLIYGTLLDDIGILTREMGAESMLITGLFLVFVLLAALTVMNMLIGVLCEVVSAVAATEKEEMLVTWVKSKIEKIFLEVDQDQSATVTRKEFVGILENVVACRVLQDVGVDVVGLVDFADAIFEDEGSCEKELTFHEFMEVVLQLRGCNNATVKDIVDLRKLIQKVSSQTHIALTQIRRISNAMDFEASRRISIESSSDIRRMDSTVSNFQVNPSCAYDGELPRRPANAVQCDPLELLGKMQTQSSSSNVVLLQGATWEPLGNSPRGVVLGSEKSHSPSSGAPLGASVLPITNGLESNGMYKVQSPSQSRTWNCGGDTKSGEAKTNGHGIGCEEIKIQLKRLDDALQNLTIIRKGFAKCVLLDLMPDEKVPAGFGL